MELTWLDPVHVDDGAVAGAVAVLEAARLADYPHQLGPTVGSFTADLGFGWHGDRPQYAVAQDAYRRVLGVLEVYLPNWDNTHLGSVLVTVDPLCRRQGIGRRLCEVGVERVRACRRTVVLADCWDQTPGMAFCKAMGFDPASEEVLRHQDVLTLDWARLDHEYAQAERHAQGYELVRLPGATPESMIASVATMMAAINDAPTDSLDIEDVVYSPRRIRDFEAAEDAHRRRTYRVIARERATGTLAGHTQVAVEGERPGYGSQYHTSVLVAHRGHRLGLCLKIDMLRWLREVEPQLRTLDTFNAASNVHMIGVNEALGYRVVAHATNWQQHL